MPDILGGAFFVHSGSCGTSDSCDVLQNERPRAASIGDVEDVEEEAASLSVQASAATCHAEVLAREARNDDVHDATKCCCVDASKIAAPHRRPFQASRFHERNQLAGCRGFPLAIGNCSEGNAEMIERSSDSFIEHADSGTKADRSEDGTSHTTYALSLAATFTGPGSYSLWTSRLDSFASGMGVRA